MEISFYEHWTKSGSDYITGVEFYCRYGQNETLKKVFAFGKTPYTSSKLKKELENIQHIKIKLSKYAKPTIVREKLPTELKAEYDKLKALIQEISYKNAQLELLPSNGARLSTAKEILTAAAKRREIFNRLDYFNIHGVDLKKVNPKKVKPINELTPEEQKVENLKRLYRLRSSRSKLSKNPKRVLDYNNICQQIIELEKSLA